MVNISSTTVPPLFGSYMVVPENSPLGVRIVERVLGLAGKWVGKREPASAEKACKTGRPMVYSIRG